MPVLVAFLIALAGGWLLTPLFRLLARRTGFLAYPSARGVHVEPTPLLGGAAIFAAFLLAVLVGGALSEDLSTRRMIGFLAGGALVFTMGVIDDKIDLSWFSKLIGQIVAAVLLLASDNTGGLVLTPGGLVLALFWLVGLANALNFLDNMDGICAGISVVIAGSIAGLALLAGQPGTALLAAAIGGGALGYLRWNFPPAKIFLGDGGSLFLGYSLASLGLMTTRPMGFTTDLLIPVIVLAYPIFDITFVSVTRVSRGQSLTQGGRDHSSHRLNRIVGGPRATAISIYAICAILGGITLALQRIGFAPATVVAFLVVLFGFVGFGARLCRDAPVPDPAPAHPAPVS